MALRVARMDPRGSLFLALLIAAWWTVTGPLHWFPEYILPSPHAVARSFLRLASLHAGAGGLLLGYQFNLWEQAAHSVARLLMAFAVACAIAIPLGALMGRSSTADALLDPIAQVLRPIPPIAWTPLAILWFGIGLRPIIFIIVLGAVWPILLHTMTGVKQARPLLVRAAQTLGATRSQVFMRVVIPSALPFVFTGIRTGLTVGWWMIVPAEMIAADNGLGFMIMRARENGRIDDVVTGIIAIALVGYGLSVLLARIGRIRAFRGA